MPGIKVPKGRKTHLPLCHPSGVVAKTETVYIQGFHPCLWSYQAFGL